VNFDLLPATREELWAIHDYVRQHDKLGQEWDRDLNTRLMEALLDAQANPDRMATLMLFEEELWQIDRQIPSGLMIGTQPVGRTLLLKVMQLLVKTRGGDDHADHAGAGEDAGAGARGDAHQTAAPR